MKGVSMLHYCERLNKLEAETLEIRRLKLDLVMYYNILNGFHHHHHHHQFIKNKCQTHVLTYSKNITMKHTTVILCYTIESYIG